METIPAVPTRRAMVMENRRTTLLTEVQSNRRPMRVVKARSRYGTKARHRPVWQIHQHQVLRQRSRVQPDRKRRVHYMQVMEKQNTLIMEELTVQMVQNTLIMEELMVQNTLIMEELTVRMVQNTLIMEELIVQMVHHGYLEELMVQNTLIMEELTVRMVQNTLIMEELIVQMVHHGYLQVTEKQNKLVMEELISRMVHHGQRMKIRYVLIMERQISR